MTKSKNRKRRRLIEMATAGTLGGGAGFLLSRALGRSETTAILAELVKQQAWLSTAGPVIAVGTGAAAAIACATLLPYITIKTLERTRKENTDGS